MKIWRFTFLILLLILAAIIIALFQLPDQNLHIIACNVGQGDAILMIYKNIQILTDGGPGSSVLDCLGKYLPFYDREIELVILTHPEKDHYGGLVEVFRQYKVDNFLRNPIQVSSNEYQLLEKVAGRGGVRLLSPADDHKLRLGMIYLDILNPNEDVLAALVDERGYINAPKGGTNVYSIVSLVSFGKFRGLLTGDMPPEVSDSLAANWSFGTVNYIKIPHHGSKNGLTQSLLENLMPKVGIISVGKNSYGQPNREVLEMLAKHNVKTLRTDEAGDIQVITDGKGFWVVN